MERHEYAAALKLLTDYLRLGGTHIAPERARAVEQEIARLRQRVAELTLHVDDAIHGAKIFVNDVPVGLSPLREPVLVNVGKAVVRVEQAGYAPFVQSLSVAGADRRRIRVQLEPLPAAIAPRVGLAALDSRELRNAPNMTPCWISFGAAVVLGGTTATFGVLGLSARQDQNALLASYPGRPRELEAARGRLQTYALLTDTFAAATLAAGIFSVYFLVSPPERRADSVSRRANLRVTATPTGVTLGGAF